MGPITREELVRLTVRSNRAAARHWMLRLLFHVGSIGLALYLIEHVGLIWGLLVLLPHLAAFSFFGWAGIGHELFHNSVFPNRRLNQFLFKLCSILVWSNYGYFQISHAYHHRNTLAADDAEGMPHPAISRLGIIWLFTFDLPTFVRRLRVLGMNAAGVVPGGMADALFPEGSAARGLLVRAARGVLAFQFGTAIAFIALGEYWLLLAVNLAPFCLTFFNRTLAICQHYGLKSQVHGDYPESCRTIMLPPVMAFFYANMNYHVEHHMYPSVPFYNLPHLSALLRQRVPFSHLSYGYRAAMREIAAEGLFQRP